MNRLRKPPVLGISMGDPAGIGPEIILKALIAYPEPRPFIPVVFGRLSILNDALKLLVETHQLDNPLKLVRTTGCHQFDLNLSDVVYVCEDDIPECEITQGEVSAHCGRTAYASIATMIRYALEGSIDATVTAPINKESINLAGIPQAGHTEIYSHLTGVDQAVMMLVDGAFRVAHVSTHVPLREACDRVKADRVLRTIELCHQSLVSIGIVSPRIAVAGLNPHAGEHGLFGNEETQEIAPAIRQAVQSGIDAIGPIPPDTVFAKAISGSYDAVIAMYHDQGHIPMKVKWFSGSDNPRGLNISGVNVTLGLPIIRVSVDHGTAFEIAWKGIASPGSMINALEYAVGYFQK